MLCFIHNTFQSFSKGIETRAVFLDISKGFVKVWHKGLFYKLKQNGISGNLLNIITDFVSLRKHSLVLNGQNATWVNIKAGDPKEFVLGPLLFLIYVNDISDVLTLNPKLFVDDTSLFSVFQNINQTTTDLNIDLSKISDWAFQWKRYVNLDCNKQV